MATTASAAAITHDHVEWRGGRAVMTAGADGAYHLTGPFGERAISAPARNVDTASVLFDGLYTMARDDLAQDSVTAIRDGAYDHKQPIPCVCFATGAKWPYVWTRDVAYSIDLGLGRFDPVRARNSLLFKLSGVRAKGEPEGLYVMEDTGSGGSWPVSTDRVVWFLGARHLLDDKAFADKVLRALVDTLAQDRTYAYDVRMGLYRGETSFLDWREQTYPAWTARDVVFIARSFALSTNVLHYEALRLAARMAAQRNDEHAASYSAQAETLKQAINAHFWRADRHMYMSYIGGDGLPVDSYDMLGLALAITSGVADGKRARASLAAYPVWPAGSPVIWPERRDQPIYHNRAIWPFVSAYALRAARELDDPAHIALQIRSLMRGPALAGSNMENYELVTQSTHVDEGPLSGPVVDSPRQLWSVAAYLDMVREGVFGLTADGRIEPKIPASLVPMLFGDRDAISLTLPDRRLVLKRPERLDGNLLVAGNVQHDGADVVVTLKAVHAQPVPLRDDAPMYAPAAPAAPEVMREGDQLVVVSAASGILYRNGQRVGPIDGTRTLSAGDALQCFRVTRVGPDGLESLPSRERCEGSFATVGGDWPRTWTAPTAGRYQVALEYRNDHGPINTGITAAVKRLAIRCDDSPMQMVPIVMPHSIGVEHSITASFSANAGARCTFALDEGFNMSFLAHNAHYTGGEGGNSGPLNDANIGALRIVLLQTR